MIKNVLFPFAAVAVAMMFFMSAGCEKTGGAGSGYNTGGGGGGGSGGGGGGNSSVVGTWKITSWRDPEDNSDNHNTGFTFTFKSDGNFDFRGTPAGTYSVSGSKITGSGATGKGKFDISLTKNGNTLDGGFYEHWAKKTVGVTAVKQ